MLERLKILVQLQWTNKTRLHAKHSKRIYVYVAIRIVLIILMTVIVGLLLHVIKNILFIPIGKYFMIFIILLTQVMSIIAAFTSFGTDIYQSEDNQILFTLPAKNDEIFFSKLIVYYINEFIRNLFFLIPFLIAYGFMMNESFWFYLNLIPIAFILPLITVFISAILSIIITFIQTYLNRHTWLTFSIFIVLIGFVFYVVYQLVGLIPDNIRIVQLYNSFIVGLTRFMQQVASIGNIYTTLGQVISGTNVLVNYLIIIGVLVGLFGIIFLICRPLFFYLTSKTNENARQKNHKQDFKVRKSLFWTFFHKEFTIAKRSPNELLSNYIILIALPIIMYVLNVIYMGMARSTIGNQLVLIFNLFITLMIVAASNTASAVSITTEGSKFILLKTAPSKTLYVAWAKMAFNFMVTSCLLVISFVLFSIALPVFNQTDIWLLFVFIFFMNASHILWSFQIDILNPKLSDYASTGSLSNNKNIAKSLSNGLVVALILTLISILLFIFFSEIAWYVLIGLAILWFILRFYQFKTYLDAYFPDIEY